MQRAPERGGGNQPAQFVAPLTEQLSCTFDLRNVTNESSGRPTVVRPSLPTVSRSAAARGWTNLRGRGRGESARGFPYYASVRLPDYKYSVEQCSVPAVRLPALEAYRTFRRDCLEQLRIPELLSSDSSNTSRESIAHKHWFHNVIQLHLKEDSVFPLHSAESR